MNGNQTQKDTPTTDPMTCPICTGPKQADEPECSVCRDEPKPEAYTAFKETDACARCGEGESWTVKGPDGLCIGQSWEGDEAQCNALETAEMLNGAFEAGRRSAAAPDLLASLKEMGDWIAAGLQASDEAWPDERCLKHTEEIAARARAAVDKAEGRSSESCEKCGGSGRLTIYDTPTYVGQLCSPIGDEPCPKCSPDGNAT